MKTAIHIDCVRCYAYHGVLPQERKVGNYFTVEITIYTDFSRAFTSDSLDDTVNYAEVCQIIQEEMAIPANLLEHVAGKIVTSLQTHFPQIEGGRVVVTKEKPPILGEIDNVSAIVEW